jgi:hypothetical protein
MSVRVVIRAFNEQGYHRDILVMSEKQVHQHDERVNSPQESCLTGLIGHGGSIRPSDFPEMVKFEVVLDHDLSDRR